MKMGKAGFLKQKRKNMDITIKDEYIRLGQALKLAGLVGSGVEAKVYIAEGEVLVNGEVETRRGKKLREGDTVSLGDQAFTVHTESAE